MANKPVTVTNGAALDAAAQKNNALWYAFTNDGSAYLIARGTAAAALADTGGVHGYSTIENAWANPNSNSGPTNSWAQAGALPTGGGTFGVIEIVSISSNQGAQPVAGANENPITSTGKKVASKVPVVGGAVTAASDAESAATAAANAAKDVATGISSLDGFLSTLGEPDTWIRVAKVLLGGTLLVLGLAKITGLEKDAGSLIGKAAKAAPFLAL